MKKPKKKNKKDNNRRQDDYEKLTIWIPKVTRQAILLKSFKKFVDYLNTKPAKVFSEIVLTWMQENAKVKQLLSLDENARRIFKPYFDAVAKERAILLESEAVQELSAVVADEVESQEEPLTQEESEDVGSNVDGSIPSGETGDNRGQ